MKDIDVPAGYKNTDVGVIPEDWDVKPLHTIAKIQSGIAKNSNISVNRPVLVHYLRVANVQDGFLDLTDINKIEVSQDDLKRYEVLPGDVLMNEGGDLDKLGRGSIWHGEFNPCVHQNHVFVVRSCSELFSEYLNIWTGGVSARRYFLVAGKQTTNLATINKTALGQLPVALPIISEQKAIARVLSDVDELIRECDSLLAKKRDIKQGTMQQLLTGKQRLPGFSDEWEVTKFSNITNSITCGLAATPKYVEEENGKPFLSAQNIRNGKVVYKNYRYISVTLFHQITKNNKPEKGDLLYTRVGAGIGEAGVIEDNFEFGIYVSLTLIKVNHKFLYNYYLLHLLNSPKYKALAKNGQFAGGGVQNLNVEIVREFLIPLPTLPEQKAIAEILSDMDAEIEALEQKRDKYKAIKQGMMQELLTGRTRLVD